MNGGLPEFSRDGVCSTDDSAIDDQAATDSCAEGEGNEVIQAATGATFPFGVGHAIGVVFDDTGKPGEFGEAVLEKDVLPTFDVGEVVDEAFVEVNEAWHSHSDGRDVWVIFLQGANDTGNFANEGVGFFETLGVNARGFFDDIAPVEHTDFHRGAPKIYANGQRKVAHRGELTRELWFETRLF